MTAEFLLQDPRLRIMNAGQPSRERSSRKFWKMPPKELRSPVRHELQITSLLAPTPGPLTVTFLQVAMLHWQDSILVGRRSHIWINRIVFTLFSYTGYLIGKIKHLAKNVLLTIFRARIWPGICKTPEWCSERILPFLLNQSNVLFSYS